MTSDPPLPISTGGAVTPGGVDPVRSALLRYVDDMNPHTARSRRNGLAAFQAWSHTETITEAILKLIAQGPDFATAMLEAWMQDLVREDYADNTIRARILAITGLLRQLRNLGCIAWRAEPPLPSPDAYSARSTEGCGVDGFHAMLQAAHAQESPTAERDVAILLLLWRGLRVGELCDLDLGHVEIAPHSRLNILGKWRTRREFLDIADYQVEALSKWIALRGQEPGPLFLRLDRARPAAMHPRGERRKRRERKTSGGQRLTDNGVRYLIAKIGKMAGLPFPVCHPHAIRHACGTELLERDDGNIRRMMQFLRLRSPATAIRYDDNRRKLGLEGAKILDDSAIRKVVAHALQDLSVEGDIQESEPL